ncbi:MAG: hypothetical protein WDZ73_01330 [Candidatus Paceibacterota bacterium]
MIKSTQYYTLSVIIFIIAGGLHLLRVINDWDLVLGGFLIPAWVSVAVVILLGFMVLSGLNISKK